MANRILAIRSDSIGHAGLKGKLRVLLLTPGGNAASGESVMAEGLASSLGNDGWPATVVNVGETGPVDSRSALRLRTIQDSLNKLRKLVSAVSGHDLVHIISLNESSFWTFVVPMLVLARFFSKRIMLTFEPSGLDQFLERWYWLARPFIRLATSVQTENLHFASIYENAGVAVDMAAFPVDGMIMSEEKDSRLQPKILFDSQLTSQNNPFCLLRAFRILKQKYPRSELVLAKGGPLEQSMCQFVASEHIYGVTFCSQTSPDQIRQLFDEADLYVSASSLAHRPQSIVQAFLARLPVIITDAETVPDLVIDRVNGLIVPINDHGAMAGALIDLVESSQMVTDIVSHALNDAKQFRWEKLGSSWRHIYRNIGSAS